MGSYGRTASDQLEQNVEDSTSPNLQRQQSTESNVSNGSQEFNLDMSLGEANVFSVLQLNEEDRLGGTDEPDNFGNHKKLNEFTKVNQFGMRKRVAQCMIDLALFAANISQLRILLIAGRDKVDFYYFLLACVCMSLVGQVAFALIILLIWERESKQDKHKDNLTAEEDSGTCTKKRVHKDKLVDVLNLASVFIVLSITLINVFISGFGIGITTSSDSDS